MEKGLTAKLLTQVTAINVVSIINFTKYLLANRIFMSSLFDQGI